MKIVVSVNALHSISDCTRWVLAVYWANLSARKPPSDAPKMCTCRPEMSGTDRGRARQRVARRQESWHRGWVSGAEVVCERGGYGRMGVAWSAVAVPPKHRRNTIGGWVGRRRGGEREPGPAEVHRGACPGSCTAAHVGTRSGNPAVTGGQAGGQASGGMRVNSCCRWIGML